MSYQRQDYAQNSGDQRKEKKFVGLAKWVPFHHGGGKWKGFLTPEGMEIANSNTSNKGFFPFEMFEMKHPSKGGYQYALAYDDYVPENRPGAPKSSQGKQSSGESGHRYAQKDNPASKDGYVPAETEDDMPF